MKQNIKQNQKGYIFVIGLVVFAILMIFSVAILVYVSTYIKSERQNISKVQALQIAEAGIDKAAYELNQDSSYTGETDTALGNGSFTVTVSAVDSTHKRVTSVGTVLYSGSKSASSTIKTTLSVDDTIISFRYGIQAGNGGFTLANTSSITGNAFSTGPIVGSGGNYIRGDVVSAGASGWIYGIHATGNVFSHLIGKSSTGTTIDKDAYYATTITNTTVTGTKHPGSSDQGPVPLPISDAQISQWESDAAAGDTISTCDGDGNYVIPGNMSLGPKKIACNLVIKNVTLTVTGPIWVTGNITTKSSTIKMDPSLGSSNVAIIADNPLNRSGSGIIEIQTSSDFQGSGSVGSFVFMISQNNSAETGGSTTAISQGQSATALVAYASHGQIAFSNSAKVKEATAYKITLINSASVTYDTGLPSTLFEAGPGASWTFAPGSYVIQK